MLLMSHHFSRSRTIQFLFMSLIFVIVRIIRFSVRSDRIILRPANVPFTCARSCTIGSFSILYTVRDVILHFFANHLTRFELFLLYFLKSFPWYLMNARTSGETGPLNTMLVWRTKQVCRRIVYVWMIDRKSERYVKKITTQCAALLCYHLTDVRGWKQPCCTFFDKEMGKWRKIKVTSSLVSVIETKPNFEISHGYTTSSNHFRAIHIVRYVLKGILVRYMIQTLVAKIVVKSTHIWRQFHKGEANTIFHLRSAPLYPHFQCWSDFFRCWKSSDSIIVQHWKRGTGGAYHIASKIRIVALTYFLLFF